MSIGIGNLLNMFLHNGATNTVKAGVLHRSDPPQAILVESEADLEHLGEAPAGSIAYIAGYGSMWQLSAAGSWEEIQEEGGGSFAPDITNPQDGDTLVYNATAGKWVNGSGGGFLKVGIDVETETLDKTWQEIHDARAAGYFVNIIEIDGDDIYSYFVSSCSVSVSLGCTVLALSPDGNIRFTANSKTDYPVMVIEG